MANYYVNGYKPPAGVKDKQGVMLWQKVIGVKADGVWGAQSQKAYETYVRKMAKGGIGGLLSGVNDVLHTAQEVQKPRAVGRFTVPNAFKTTEDVKNFQRKNGLQADGIWGAQTDRAYRESKRNPLDVVDFTVGTVNSAAAQMKKEQQTKARTVKGYQLPKANMTIWEVKQFQSQNGLKVDGIWGKDTQAKWNAVHKAGGVAGAAGAITGIVKQATQTAKTVKGYQLPRVGMTTAEVMAFQRAQGLKTDGIWGKDTQSAWDRLSGLQKASVLIGHTGRQTRPNNKPNQSLPTTTAPLSGTLGTALKKGGQSNPLLQSKPNTSYNGYAGALGTTNKPVGTFGTNDIAKRTAYYNQGANVQAQNSRTRFWNDVGRALTQKHTVDTKALTEQWEELAQKVGTDEQVQHMQDVKDWVAGGMNGPAPQQKNDNPNVLKPKGNGDNYASMFTNVVQGAAVTGQPNEETEAWQALADYAGSEEGQQFVQQMLGKLKPQQGAQGIPKETDITNTNAQAYIQHHKIGSQADEDEKMIINELLASYLTGNEADQQVHDTLQQHLRRGYRIWQLNMFTGEPLPGQDAPFEGELIDEQTQQVNRYLVVMYGQASLQQGGTKLSQEEKDEILARVGGWTQGITLFNEEDRQKVETERLFADILELIVGAKNEKYYGLVRMDVEDVQKYLPDGWELPGSIYAAAKGQITDELQLALHGGGDMGLLQYGINEFGEWLKDYPITKGFEKTLQNKGIKIPKKVGYVQTAISIISHLQNLEEMQYPRETRKYTSQLKEGDYYLRLQIPEQYAVDKEDLSKYMRNSSHNETPIQAPEETTTTVSTVLIYFRGDEPLFIELEDNKSILWP